MITALSIRDGLADTLEAAIPGLAAAIRDALRVGLPRETVEQAAALVIARHPKDVQTGVIFAASVAAFLDRLLEVPIEEE